MSNYKVSSSIEQIYGLTSLQAGILYQCLRDKTSSKYITQFTIEGIQDETYMYRAISMVEEKYSVLKTAIIYKKISKPRQILLKNRNVEITKIDLSMYDDSQMQAVLDKRCHEDAERGFDLQNDSLVRIKYFVLNKNRTIMLWSIHHILLDGWSSSMIIQDFIRYYNLLQTNQSCNIQKEKEGIPEYREYVKWLDEQQNEEKLLFWKNYLKEYDSISDIMPIGVRKKEKEKINTVSLNLSSEVYGKLIDFSKVHGVTLNHIFEATWSIVLQYYSNSDDIVFGKVISGREAPIDGIEKTAGLLMNTIPFRVITDKTTTIKDLLNDVKNQGKHIKKYGVCSLVDIQGLSARKRDLIRTIFSFENYNENSTEYMQNKVSVIREETSYPITLDIVVTNKLINIRILYSSTLYERQEIDLLAIHIKKVLKLIINDEKQLVHDLDIVGANERHTILNIFNQPTLRELDNKNVIQLFEEQVAKKTEEIAIIAGEKTITYAELNQKSNQLARKLRQEGIKPNDSVILYLERSIEMMIGIYGIVKAGAVYVPVSPEYPKERVEYILKDCKPKAVLVAGTNISSDVPLISLDDASIYTGDDGNLVPVNSMEDAIYCIYTSGTTGQPKGVVNLHKGLLNRIDWMMRHYRIDSTDILLQKTIYTFDVSVCEIFMWGLAGGRLILLPYKGEMDPGVICNEINHHKITRIHFVPSMLNAFLTYLKSSPMQVQKLVSLKTVFCSGEALNLKSAKEFYDIFFHAGIDVKLANLYGPTEASIDVTYYDCQAAQSVVPIGKPISNIQIYIMNHSRLCGIGIPGELFIAGIGVAKGYMNKEQLTAEKFVQNPFGDGKVYKTGDLARWLPDGNIEYLGRIDEQVKIRGFRIELGEITSSLKKIACVKDCAVVVKQDQNGDKFICAYIISDFQIDADVIKNELSRNLPEYMIPAYIQQINFIPVTSNGKLNKGELPELQLNSECQYEAPQNENERSVCEIFESILKREQVGIKDNFFALGGHSLKAILLINRIEAKFGVSLEVQDVFQYPTPVQLCERIFNKNHTLYEPIPSAKEQEFYSMSSSQKRIYLVCQMDKNSTAYNMPQLFVLKGTVDQKKIENVLQTMVNRHEILRTEFIEKDGELVQRVRQHLDMKVTYEERDGEDLFVLVRAFTRPFDLSCSPLLRCKVVKQQNQFLLLFDTHHIISDGMSSVLFWKEFSDLYNGEQIEEVQCQFKDYSEWLNSRDLSSQKDYWLNQFSNEVPILDIPYDFKRPQGKSFNGNIVKFELDAVLSKQMQKLTNQTETTEYMVFLAATMVLLSKYSRQQDIVIGSPVSSRTHKDTEKILGMFVNTLPMRGQPTAEKSFETFLGEIKESCIKAYENQEYPLEELIENIVVVRNMSRNPLFDVMLVFQNTDKVQVQLEGIQTKCMGLIDDTSKFDLTFNIEKINEQYQVEIRYCTDLFRQETIEVLGHYFVEVIRQITEDSRRMLKEIQLNNEEDKNKILNIFNLTNVEYPKEQTMKDLFENRAEQTPDHIAVIYERQSITYKELNEKANQLARRLRAMGIDKNDFVVILVERSIEMMIAVYGVIKAGGAYVPISIGYPKERIEYIFNDCKPTAVITNGFEIETDLPIVDLRNTDIFTDNKYNLNNVNTAEDYIYCTYTSGTTGTPKGIPVRYRSLINLANWYMHEFHITEDTKNVIIAPLSFDLSMRNIFGLHMGGGTVCLCGNEHIFDAEKVNEFIRENEVSLINCAASAFYALLLADQANNYSSLRSLKNIYLVGEVLSFEKIKAYMSSENCNAHIINGYGPTEDSGISTTYRVSAADEKRPSIPIGKPLYNKKIYIMDGENLCGIGVKGEICICGAGVTDGYLNLPQLTVKKFVKDPFGEGVMFRTGDLGRWLPDGNIEFLGRVDEQIKIRGYRVELGDIETTIKRIKEVKDCAVIARSSGDSEKEIYAYIVSEQEIDILKVRKILNQKLPEYMIPVYIAQINRIPVTSNGKLDRRLLPDIELSTGKEYVAPIGEVEEKLCKIYKKVLNCESVSANDNFFELGGNSIKALKLIHEITHALRVRIEVKDLFAFPTVVGLSEMIQRTEAEKDFQLPKAASKLYYPMSSTQKRVYLVNQINGDALAYNMPQVFKLKGSVDKNKVKDAFQKMIDRYEIFRTEFISENGELVQRIKENVKVDFTYADSEIDEKNFIRKFIRPFQLDHVPLFRLQLVKREDDYLLLFDIHHIITDGISMGEMFRQFSKIYNGESIKDVVYQYKDYSEWMNGRDLSAQKEYWKKQFCNSIPILDLPLDYIRPKEKSFRGASTSLMIQGELYHAIDILCKETETTPYMVFLSAVMILLSKYSGQEEVVVGNGISGRVYKDTEDMLGMFVNTLAMLGKPAKEKSYTFFLSEIKSMCLDAYSNQEYPFEELVNDISVERDISRNPLFDVMLVFQNVEKQTINLKGIETEEYDFEKVATKFDLTFKIFAEKNCYQVVLEYATDLFGGETAKRWNAEFLNILLQITSYPQKTIHDVQAEIGEDQKRIIEKLNRTKAYYPKEKTVVDLFEEQVMITPEKIAVRYDEQTITYDELNQKANQLARKLRYIGVRPNDFVVILAKRSIEMLVAVYGILKAGGAYVPISPAYPEARIQFMLEDCQPKAVLCYQVESETQYPVIDLSDEKTFDGDSSNLEKVNVPEDRLYCTYTSGTTGTPKGIPVCHRSEVNLITWYKEKFEITQETRNTIIAPLSFDLAQRNIFAIHTSGGMLCLHGDEEAYDAIMFAEFIQKSNITMLNCAASAFYALLFADRKNTYQNLQSLKKIYLVGEALSFEKLSPFMESPHFHADILNGYGATEDSGVASVYAVKISDGSRPSIPIGKPLNNKQIYVMDGDCLCGIGMRGEICICGIGVTEGYLNQSELTEKKFVKNPFGEGRMYRTGDLGRWLSDGNLEFLGRMDEQVKVRGYRIELGEIENYLRKIEYIKDTAVIAKEDSNHETAVYAYLVSDDMINVSEIREKLLKVLPEYMVPAYIGQIDHIPVTSNGKLDRRALPDIRQQGEKEYVAPENEFEEILCKVFEEILRVDRVGVNDGFFERGGHSLKALMVVNRIEELGVHIGVKDIFTNPTVKGLAEVIQSMVYTAYEPIPEAKEKECYPMSSTQKRTYIVCQIDEAGIAYHMPYILRLSGMVDAVRVKEVIQGIVNRHEILRTEFITRGGEFLQRIVKDVEADHLYYEDAVCTEEDLIQKFIKPFDFEKAPMFRSCLVKRDQGYLLMFDTHHIVSDGMSMENFLHEFAALYNNEQLLPVARQYKDYSEWMRKRDLSEQKEYWVHEFEDEIPVLEMPLDYVRSNEQSFRGAIASRNIDSELQQEIKAFARQNNVTEYMIFLSVAMILLSKYSRQDDIIIGSPISGRTHKETEKMLGMFVNTLAMRGKPEGEKSYENFLKEVKESCFKAYENQEYPFEELVEEIGLPRNPSRNPLFDVMLVLQNNEKSHIYLDGVDIYKIPNSKKNVKFDLTFNIFEEADGYEIVLEYCTDIYKGETAEWILNHFIDILRCVLKNKNIKNRDIEMVCEEEKKLIVKNFNDTVTEYPRDKTVIELFEEQVAKTPNHTALVYEKERLTYEELNKRANGLAYRLREQGVRPDEFVAVIARKSIEIVLGILGIVKAGGAYVPVDPDYPEERIRFMIKDCSPKAVLVYDAKEAEGTIRKNFSELPVIDLADSRVWEGATRNLRGCGTAENAIYCIYTSGTTGQPKGSIIENRSVIRLVKDTNYIELDGHTVILQTGSMSFDASTLEVWGSLLNGGKLVLAEQDVITNQRSLRDLLCGEKINMMWLTSTLFNQMISEENDIFDSLEHLLIGGEKLSNDHVRVMKGRNNGVKLTNGYGPTENTTFTTTYEIPAEFDEIPIGRPIANTKVYILDGNKLCGIGVPGELCIVGDGLARGYLNRPELTAEKFVKNPFGEGKMYRSGDMARWLPDGNIEFLGRFDEQVKIRGFRIEIGEIESRICEIEGIKDCAVIAKMDAFGDKVIYAYFVGDIDRELSISEIRDKLAVTLPNYMIPSYMMQIDKIPVTRNGKIDKMRLPEIEMKAAKEYIAPENEKEEILCKVFSEMLHAETVGIKDSFYELGGDSIKAIRIVSQIREYGYKLSIRDVLSRVTVQEIAAYMKRAEDSVYIQGEVNGAITNIPFIDDLVSSGDKNIACYNQVKIIKIGNYDEGQICMAMSAVILHHDILRSIFADNQLVTLSSAECKWYDYYEIESDENNYYETTAKEIKKIQRSFNLSEGSLVKLARFSADCGAVLFICIHSLIIDKFSWKILIDDIYSALDQVGRNSTVVLPDKTLSYQEWAVRLNEYRNSRDIQEQKVYWDSIVEQRCETSINFDIKGTDEFGDIVFSFDQSTTEMLLHKAMEAYHSELNDILLTALGRTVYGWKESEKVMVWLVKNIREDSNGLSDISRTVGCFMISYPVILEYQKEIDENIIQTKEMLRAVPNNGIGYGLMEYGRIEDCIRFDFVEKTDTDKDQMSGLNISLEDCSMPLNGSVYPLIITGAVKQKELGIKIIYNKGYFSEQSIRVFSKMYEESIMNILKHCVEQEIEVYTESDWCADDLEKDDYMKILGILD